MYGVDLGKIEPLKEQELDRFASERPRSKKLYQRALKSYLYGTPLHWMQQWPGSYPIYVDTAQGARLTDVDGNTYVDFALGDTGAMFGHANEAVVEAIYARMRIGSTMMLPTEDSIWVGEELQRRFGLPFWQMATSATDANRFCLRLARMITGRDKVLVYNWNYHGSVDESQVMLEEGAMVPRHGVAPNAMDFSRTTRVIEFNDVEALEQALEPEDIACVLAEPEMTNIGMVPVEPGYHDKLRELTRRHGTVLIIDETHTISTGPGGYTRAHNLDPDMFVLGKSIAGGIPCAVYGVTEAIAERIWSILSRDTTGEEINHFGFGGTLVGNAATLAAMRATFSEIMTEDNYALMIRLATRLEEGVDATIREHGLPWHVTRIGARAEYLFRTSPPRTGGEAETARNFQLESYMHLYFLNRGILLTPFHNMALICPATVDADIDLHNEIFERCVESLPRE